MGRLYVALLSDGGGDALSLSAEAFALTPTHSLQHLEAEVLLGQLAILQMGTPIRGLVTYKLEDDAPGILTRRWSRRP